MPSKMFFFVILIAIMGCGQNNRNSKVIIKQIDTTQAKEPKALFDTTGLAGAPIKILKTSIKSKEFDMVDKPEDNLHHEGHFKRFITLTVRYKNVSSKRITGAKLNWIIVDKDDMPAEVASGKTGMQYGVLGTLSENNILDYSLGIGKTKVDGWEYDSKKGSRIKIAFPSEVEFYDGSKWRIGYK